jgi:protein-tyrosine phosphatase
MKTSYDKTSFALRITDNTDQDINLPHSNLYNAKLRRKKNEVEQNRVNHLYIKEVIILPPTDEARYQKIVLDVQLDSNQSEYLSEDEKKKRYNKEEDDILCGKFPHLTYCGCKYPCSIILNNISPVEIGDQILVGPIESVYKTKELLKLKVSHILNVACTAYNQRKYFKYLNIFVADNHTENAIKFFKITNRFIEEALIKGERVLIHSLNGKSRAWVFLMAYLIGKEKMKFAKAYEYVKEKFPGAEPNENFLTQLKHYDLETNV